MNEREHFSRVVVLCLFLALIAALEWYDIRILHQLAAVQQQRINNYAEECGDRTDAPAPTGWFQIPHAGKFVCACKGATCACYEAGK